MLLLAVLDKRCGVALDSQDVYVNVTGGLTVREPAADLGIAVAVASARLDRPVPADILFLGEVGLGGEVRAVSQATERLAEAAKLGFKRAVVPRSSLRGLGAPKGLEVLPAGSLLDALRFSSLLSKEPSST
jgi:DNA repair protein RadA/Sms